MFNRTVKAAAAIGFGAFAILIIDGYSLGTAYADECRANPGTQTPPGGHWRYRIEKGTGKKCWYLAGETSKTGSVVETQSSSPNTGSPPLVEQQTLRMRPSVANAHAELTASDSAQSALAETTWPPMSEVNAVNATTAQDSTPAQDQQPAQQQNLVLAQRWPTPTAVPSSDPQPQTAQAETQLRAAARDAQSTATPAQSAATPVQTAQHADDTETNPMRILLVAAIGALALIAILLRTIIGYVHKRKRRVQRRPHWHDAIPHDRYPSPSTQRSIPTQPQRFVREIPEDERDEIEYLLRRASRRAQN